MAPATQALAGYQQLYPDYRQSRAQVFKSDGSLQWYVRQHRAQLIACGALVRHAGQWFADAARFDAYVVEAAQAAARQQLAPAAA